MTTSTAIQFTLPWPPSVNTYYRAISRGRFATNILSKKGRDYPKHCKLAIGFWPHAPIAAPVSLTVDLFPPDRRRRDLDNHLKPIQDALTKCRIWSDDVLVNRIVAEIHRDQPRKGGEVEVQITEIES